MVLGWLALHVGGGLITGGTGGSATPLETAPAPSTSFVTTTAVPNGSGVPDLILDTRGLPRKSPAIPTTAIPPTTANMARRFI
jgi:hypothetical protein